MAGLVRHHSLFGRNKGYTTKCDAILGGFDRVAQLGSNRPFLRPIGTKGITEVWGDQHSKHDMARNRVAREPKQRCFGPCSKQWRGTWADFHSPKMKVAFFLHQSNSPIETPPEVRITSHVALASFKASRSEPIESATAGNRTGVWPANSTKPANP